ncbi:hypothetical protein AB0K47_05795 [Streptomyces tirandamycinicus]|uniref:Uncharacterized protein n=1 Tax=Streptomyces tirandamycinicus TaxID=2174846 RepID=A0A2S1T0G5_9ACTN|nr:MULTISPECIES: hypothetical protein [Streptomyces]AWI32138.1 hypothetical protein DDW44_27585 [Streptomyces tirandamycinicus]MCY0983931.1 hypothetical protein [Streptomyces tirandamycinicus]NNJ08214.1 hypothetical protein [Streptomyces sp. PKU-MA01144]
MAKRSNTLGATRIRLAAAGLGLGALFVLGAAGTAVADGTTDAGQGGVVSTTPTDGAAHTDWNSTGS